MRTIYLDYVSSTPIAASVQEAIMPYLTEFYGHPASGHWFGRAAQEAIEDARSNLSLLLDCHPAELTFTSGGTESVNLALLGVARAIGNSQAGLVPHLITTELEHACVHLCAEQLKREGWDVTYLGCDRDGIVSSDSVEAAITESTRLVSISHANHFIGTLQPIKEISAVCQQHDILLHTDAAQTVGKIDVHVEQLGVDLLTLSGHKIYAPKGVGALYVKTGVPIEPVLFGEGCESGLRPGTANVPHIVGLGQAAKLARSGLMSADEFVRDHDHVFLNHLSKYLEQDLTVYGGDAPRVPGVVCVDLPNVSVDEIQAMLPELCLPPSATGNGPRSRQSRNRTHAAMGLTGEQSANALLVSFGWNSSREEVERAARMIASAYESIVTP